MGDIQHLPHRHEEKKKSFISFYYYYYFVNQKKKEHIDKAIRKHIDCNYQSFHKFGKALSDCGLITGKVGSNDLSHYPSRATAKPKCLFLGATHGEPQPPQRRFIVQMKFYYSRKWKATKPRE